MALRNLTVKEMIGVTSSWLAPDDGRAVFEGSRTLSALTPEIERVHSELLRAEPAGPSASTVKELAKIVADTQAQDAIHDQNARIGFRALEIFIELVGPSSTEGRRYAVLRDALYPQGLGFTGESYVSEAGHAIKTRAALDKSNELRTELRDIILWDKRSGKRRTLLEVVRAQIKAGISLGKLEARRSALLHPEAASSPEAQARPTLAGARNAWMTVVGDVLRLARYVPPKERKIVQAALAHLERAERLADARVSRRGESPAETDNAIFESSAEEDLKEASPDSMDQALEPAPVALESAPSLEVSTVESPTAKPSEKKAAKNGAKPAAKKANGKRKK